MAGEGAGVPKKNVLFLFCDQLRFDCLGYAGHPLVRTPNLDRLASASAVFTTAFTSTPVCVPARHSLMTGLRNGAHRQAGLNPAPGPIPELPTLMTVMMQSGYDTKAVGKTHFKGRQYGFRSIDTMEECPAFLPDDDYLLHLREQGVTTRFQHGMRDLLYYQPQTLPTPLEHSPNEWVADRSISYLEEHRCYRPDKPFFLFSSYIHPHPPFAASEPYASMYDPADIELPIDTERPMEELGHGALAHRGRLSGAHRDPDRMRRIKALYFGLVSHVDACIGRTIDALETMGMAEDTVIIFASDHGEMLGDHGLSQKNVPFEPSIRIPFMISWPDMPARKIDRTVSLLDVFPTLLEGLDLARPVTGDALAGNNLMATLAGGEADDVPADMIVDYGYRTDRWLCLRTPTHKYTYWYSEGYEELYDLQADPNECGNLLSGSSPAAEHTAMASEMKARLLDWERKYGFPELLEDGEFPVIAVERPQAEDDIPSILMNQGKWAVNLPEDEAHLIDSMETAISRAIAGERTLNRQAVNAAEYERLGGSLKGTPLAADDGE